MFNHGMEFDLGEDIGALREMVHRFAQERIKPLAAKTDTENAVSNELWQEFGELGLLGITVAEECRLGHGLSGPYHRDRGNRAGLGLDQPVLRGIPTFV